MMETSQDFSKEGTMLRSESTDTTLILSHEYEKVNYSKMALNGTPIPLNHTSFETNCTYQPKASILETFMSVNPNHNFPFYQLPDYTYFTQPQIRTTSTPSSQNNGSNTNFQAELGNKFFTSNANMMMRDVPSDENPNNGKILSCYLNHNVALINKLTWLLVIQLILI